MRILVPPLCALAKRPTNPPCTFDSRIHFEDPPWKQRHLLRTTLFTPTFVHFSVSRFFFSFMIGNWIYIFLSSVFSWVFLFFGGMILEMEWFIQIILDRYFKCLIQMLYSVSFVWRNYKTFWQIKIFGQIWNCIKIVRLKYKMIHWRKIEKKEI